MTKEIGGSPYPNAPSFMSENPEFYAQLADPENLSNIKISEADIKKRSYSYIPKSEIWKRISNQVT